MFYTETTTLPQDNPPRCALCRFWKAEHSGWGTCSMPTEKDAEVIGRLSVKGEFWCKAYAAI